MTDNQVGFLYKAASSIRNVGDTKSLSILRSYYLMRCKDITKGRSLPDKHFSTKARCCKCCIEWRKDTETKINTIKLSKKQRRRIRSQKTKKFQKRMDLLTSNEIEQICSFCKQSTKTSAFKPEKIKTQMTSDMPIANSNIKKNITKLHKEANKAKNLEIQTQKSGSRNKKEKAKNHNKTETILPQKVVKKNDVNVYSNTAEVFSLNNTKNTITNTKEGQKIIKNNKKKKDKFAGLCQKAVLASAKLKEEKTQSNKINLFLKPST